MRTAALASLLLAIAGLAGCPRRLPPPTPPAGDDATGRRARAEAVRAEVRTLLREQGDALWRAWVEGEPLDLADSWVGRESLLAPQTLALLEAEARVRTSAADAASLSAVRRFLLDEAAARATGPIDERIAGLFATQSFEHEGRTLPFRDLGRVLAAEPDAAERARLHAEASTVFRQLLPLLEERARIRAEALARAGADEERTPGRLGSASGGIGAAELSAWARGVLDGTRDPYLTALHALARQRTGLEPAEVGIADLPRILAAAPAPAPETLSETSFQPHLDATLAALGLSTALEEGVTVHRLEAPAASPRALCIPLDAPGDVRLVLPAAAGAGAVEAALREVGHALFLSSLPPPAADLHTLGSDAPTLAAGWVLSSLVTEPAWLESRGLEASEARELADARRAIRLLQVRRAAAVVLATVPPSGAAPSLGEAHALLEEAYGFAVPDESGGRTAQELAGDSEAVDLLLAHLLAARVLDDLARSTGTAWWEDPRSGPRALEALRHPDSVHGLFRDGRLGPPTARTAAAR